ncbi:PilZ domain-containing protein [Treponema bryantii]|uniref:PilZ domain-containing protein n=2 Tax=Treponema bryantii TaxID=163 RepID=A0A1H9B4V0_9SPIR|nr:PilZ domain-containing protein [Treponema bryantii]
MYTVTFLIILVIILAIMGAVYTAFKPRINFFITGLDSGFSFPEISMLWNAAELCNLEQPTSLFYSLPSLTKCMTQISNITSADNNQKNQLLMTKLFNYRTKIQNEADEKKGMTTTHSLDKGQPLRIILPGKGVFVSEIVGNGNFLVINVPRQKNLIPFTGEDWVGKVISVYLWRKGDARYVFDTTVTQSGLFLGKSALFLKHSSNLVRTQKRKAVRVKCQIYGMLYIIKKEKIDINAIETQNGFRCLIEDISEAGALIRIGGKGVQNVKIKLQFNIQNKLILMVGIVRTVEFNEEQNQSLLHFECTHIETSMRNEVLKFVYNMMPENEKEVMEALEQTEDDEKEALEQAQENADKPENAEKSENPEGTVEENKPSENETEAAVATETNEIAQDLAEATGRSISTSETQDSKPKSDSSDDIPNKADEINVF